MVSHRGGVPGRTWRLPSTEPEASRRKALLALLGLGEPAVSRTPDPDDRQVNVSVELSRDERVWLDTASQLLGLSAGATGSRILRVLARALIRNRDLLPVELDFDESTQAWLSESDDVPLEQRVRPWADSLPEDKVRAIIAALEASLVARRRR